ncbi:hypothetical protein AB0C77_23535, partial [Streptomyces sp. NPDC048629]|uniref:hypothetical protein n=1 Tax=Streptomyces sp. NPDC048629 TaxID=3154824 RepID=UPI00343A5CA4
MIGADGCVGVWCCAPLSTSSIDGIGGRPAFCRGSNGDDGPGAVVSVPTVGVSGVAEAVAVLEDAVTGSGL